MKCSKVRDKLMDYASAELTPSEMEEVRGHLATCEGCRTELAIAQDASGALSFLNAEESTPDLVSAVRRRLDQEQMRRPVLVPRLAMAFATVLVCIVVVTGWLMWRPAGHQNTNMAHRPGMARPPVVAEKIEKPGVADHSLKAPEPVKHGTSGTIAVSRPRPHIRHAVASAPKSYRSVRKMAPAPTRIAHSAQPEIRIAVSPRQPESYIVPVGAEEQAAPARVSVVRHFDVGGNVRSVTITDRAEPAAKQNPPVPGNTRRPDARPSGSEEAVTSRPGGSIYNA
jgi:hypothetical protein